MAITAKELIGDKTPDNAIYDINAIRRAAKIDIMLPDDMMSDNKLDKFEVFDVDGKTIQIKKGEPITVNWIVFEAIVNSGRYKSEQILR